MISFHTAAASGNVDQIHELLESGIEVNGRNSVSYLYKEVVQDWVLVGSFGDKIAPFFFSKLMQFTKMVVVVCP